MYQAMILKKSHIYRIVFFSVWIFLSFGSYGQGRINRPPKSNPQKSQTQRPQPQKNQTIQQDDPVQRYNDSIAQLPREEEYINNILVRWKPDITNEQKMAITTLINNMVDIEGGVFIIGSDSHTHYWEYEGKRYYIEEPSHSEKVKSFKLNRYEVTQKIWESIMGNNPSRYYGDDYPVTNVSWNDCQSFINKIQLLSDIKFRLPTETEWEYVARKYLPQVHEEYIDYIKRTEWVSNGSDKMPHSVGSKESNSFGIYDIIGNVREWTSDHASLDYNHPRNLSDYIARGGSYNCWDYVYIRNNFSPSYKKDTLGFRLAL